MHCSKLGAFIASLVFLTSGIFPGISTQLQAQENSPFSRFGVGDVLPEQFTLSRSMGGISAGLFEGQTINFANPASYAFLNRTTLDFGVYGNILTVATNDLALTSGNGSVQNISMAFPAIKNKLGLSFGLVPFARMQYDIQDTRVVDSLIGIEELIFQGDGATYQAYIGGAYRYKGFSAGLNMSYLFGNLSNTNTVSFLDLENSFATRSITRNSIGGFNWKAGLGYQASLPNDLRFNFGLSGKLSTTVNGKQDVEWATILASGGNQVVIDSIVSIDNGAGDLVLPASFTAGFTFRQGFRTKSDPMWRVGADITMASWSQYEGFQAAEPLTDSWRLMVGGEFTPGVPDSKEDAKRPIDYRLGFYYGKTNLEFPTESDDNQQLNEFGMTLGFGIPISPNVRQQSGSELNLGLEFGQRGTKDIIRDSYIRGTLGVSLSDSFWFLKSKVN